MSFHFPPTSSFSFLFFFILFLKCCFPSELGELGGEEGKGEEEERKKERKKEGKEENKNKNKNSQKFWELNAFEFQNFSFIFIYLFTFLKMGKH